MDTSAKISELKTLMSGPNIPNNIWDTLCDVCNEWGAGINSDCNNYYIAIKFE